MTTTATPSSTQNLEQLLYTGKRPNDDRENPIREQLSLVVGDMGRFHEIVPERFYLVHLASDVLADAFIQDNGGRASPFIFWNPSDGLLSYDPFNMDFGPYNLATTHLFCSKIKVWVDTYQHRHHDKCIVIVLEDNDQATKLNVTLATAISAMVLFRISDRQVLARLNFSMRHKSKPGERTKEPVFEKELKKFNDVSGNTSVMNVTIEDCVKAFYGALQHEFYNYYKFDHAEYLFYETVISGDLNWIIPGKILAFAGPSGNKPDYKRLCLKYPPKFYYHYFKDHNVSSIIRLNDPEYEGTDFTEAGFDHHDLIFPDGFPPTSTIANKFIKIVDEAKGAVAVHCYAGIGRTGTLIAAYLMARYDFSPQMATAWTRICRPGSVIGEQQDWLMLKFNATKSPTKSIKSRKIKVVEPASITSNNETRLDTTYTAAEKTYGQAKALLMTKRSKRKDALSPKTRSSKMNESVDDGDTLKELTMPAIKTNIVLDLGKTIPWMLHWKDLKELKGDRNPEYYSIFEGEYEWKAKFPQDSYVTLKHEYERDSDYFYDRDIDSETQEIYDKVTLEFRYDDEEEQLEATNQECINGLKLCSKKKPIVCYRIGKY